MVPASLSIPVLATTQLSAIARDANGNVLTGRSVQWVSSNALVVAVTNAGIITGVVLGNADIRATIDGVTAAVPVMVSLLAPQPPPPPPPSPLDPPSGAWPNLPPGYTTFADQSFNSPLSGAWALIWNQLGLGGLATNSAAPFSPSGVMQFHYAIGFVAGEAPGTVVIGLGGMRRVFVGTWWKANANWQGHSSNVNKLQFLFAGEESGDIYMAAYGPPPSGPYQLVICLQLIHADPRCWLKPNVSAGNVVMGQWHRIEWLLDYGTEGVANGTMRWWLDGQLVGDYRDILYPVAKLVEYKLSPTWGGIGGVKTQDDYFWYDPVFIAR
jgi:hypothetical protein